MKVLILTQYYPPEIGAPQNRLHELAVRLQENGITVEVLTALPNYPQYVVHEAYKTGKRRVELIDGIQVYRAGIWVSSSKGIVSRLLNYFSFVWTSYWRGRKLGQYDFLMVESPPLFLGYSGIRLARKLRAKMIFNVSDLWPESAEKMGIVTNSLLLRMAYRLEAKCYRKAHLVTGQTMGIVENIQQRFPETKVQWLPNGVDPEFYDPEKVKSTGFRNRNNIPSDHLVFFYGGILGYAQGLEVILNAASQIDETEKYTVIIQGSGPEEQKLKTMASELSLKNVRFLPSVGKNEMPEVLREVDVALVPLRKLDLFQGAMPSKIFEALSMEKALLLGVEGEAKTHFIDKAGAGLFFEPENSEDLSEKMRSMIRNRPQVVEMGKRGRMYVIDNFNRDKIAQDLIRVLKDI